MPLAVDRAVKPQYKQSCIFSEMNNDADLIFIAVWQQMIDFPNADNLFDLDGWSYSCLDFKKWSLSKF